MRRQRSLSPLAESGEACGASADGRPCVEGAWCAQVPDGGAATCARLPRLGERCGEAPRLSPACEGPTFCDVDGCAPREGVCRSFRGGGEACAANGQCESGTCEGGRCAQRCNELQRLGCAGGRRDQLSYYLFFAGLVLARRRRR